MEKIVVKVPEHIKQWYADNKYKLPMAHEAARVLIEYAIANGAEEKPKYDKDNYSIIEH
ncbi:hypothetical protein [Cytobacillus praedii]|uniref:hypothetical protein n=1 Tax=Cytobacillus praedii TaxID=1742358 RepID=UPI002E1D3A6F|nr:hypothetical protein [Cytobacillus praedii]